MSLLNIGNEAGSDHSKKSIFFELLNFPMSVTVLVGALWIITSFVPSGAFVEILGSLLLGQFCSAIFCPLFVSALVSADEKACHCILLVPSFACAATSLPIFFDCSFFTGYFKKLRRSASVNSI